MAVRQFPSPALEPLLRSPKLPAYLEAIQTILAEEHRQRENFYAWITEDIKAEFINGEIIVQSPAKNRHTIASINLTTLLSTYVDLHKLGFVGSETVLITLTRNDYLPDVCYFGTEKAVQIRPDQMKYPAPDFIAEILSPSTETIDRGVKFEDYAAHGVAEYWLIDPEDRTIEQYYLEDERYSLRLKMQTGSLAALVLPGFEIPVEAVFDGAVKNQALQAIFAESNQK